MVENMLSNGEGGGWLFGSGEGKKLYWEEEI